MSGGGGGVRVPSLPEEEDDWVRASERLRPQWQPIVARHRQNLRNELALFIEHVTCPFARKCTPGRTERKIQFHVQCIDRRYCILEISVPISISRVNQFDAARLDVEMSAMLKEQLLKVFSLMKPGMLFQYEPELDAFLEFLIWRFSIWVDKPTPGIALMNLRYRDARAPVDRGRFRTGLEGPGLSVAQKIWYCIASVGSQYIWARIQSFSAFRRWGDTNQRSLARWAWVLVQRIEGLYKAASFGNLLIFLYTGRYRNLIERALKARLVYDSPNMNRAVSFEYMNRQLVWNEFSEMLLLLLPLLNSSSLKNLLRPFSKDKDKDSRGDESVCPICQSNPSIPFLALPCRHRYCYYCLRTRCAATSSFRCPGCNEPVVAMQRHSELVGGIDSNK